MDKMVGERLECAKKLREEGWTYTAIAKDVGVSYSAVRCALDPAAREHNQKYYQEHKEEGRAWQAAYYKLHKEERKAYRQCYDAAHREEKRVYSKNYSATHKEEIKAYYQEHKEEKKAYRASRKEEIKIYQKNYGRTHQEGSRLRSAVRRALKTGAVIGATTSQLAEIEEIYRRAREDSKVRCYLCGKLIPKGHRHVDHIVPLSKGGQHRPSNLAVACDKCNLSKGSKLPNKVGVLL